MEDVYYILESLGVVFLESSRAMMESLELDGCGLESDYPFLLKPEFLHRRTAPQRCEDQGH